jgi:hypothetical protein
VTLIVVVVTVALVAAMLLWHSRWRSRPAALLTPSPPPAEIRRAVLASTVLLQAGIGGGNGRECATDYDREDCSLAFHVGLGTLISGHQILTHDHLQVIGDDVGTLKELRTYQWLKISGASGAEVILSTHEVTFAPESAPFGLFILQLPEEVDLAAVATPARIQSAQMPAAIHQVVYYPTLAYPIDSLLPYTSGEWWRRLTVGTAQIVGVRQHMGKAFYEAAYLPPIRPLMNGDCGGGTFAVIDGELLLVGTQNYTDAHHYLLQPVTR